MSHVPAVLPRPILKRHQTSRDLPSHYSQDRFHGVHFPPSPILTKTHLAHSPSTYDRSPIVVGENSLALPERGCPGRTYTLEDSQPNNTAGESPRRRSHHSGDYYHPRAAAIAGSPSSQNQRHRRTSSPMARTYTSPESDYRSHQNYFIPSTMPPLIPDLSSESDESDGFSSPSPESHNASLTSAPSIPRPRVARAVTNPTGFPNTMTPYDDASKYPPPHVSSSPDDKPKRRRHRDQEGKSLSSSSSRRNGAAKIAGEDASHYTSFALCKGLSNCSLDSSPGDCLDGF